LNIILKLLFTTGSNQDVIGRQFRKVQLGALTDSWT
jgi:hypothetical protein